MTLSELAKAIDFATDSGDVESLLYLSKECEEKLKTATSEERVVLLYYQSNTHYGIYIISKRHDTDYIWNWKQPESIKSILLLRRSINEPAFNDIDPIVACQIRTNLGSRLNTLGRPIAANAEWLKVLDTNPRFAKALAARAQALKYYAGLIYDPYHKPVLLASARSLFDKALDQNAIWESGDRNHFAPGLMEERREIADILVRNQYDEEYDLNQWSLGKSKRECSYRRWCLKERLFLNPLNEAHTDSVAAGDVLHLPDHIYSLKESPRFPLYYNLMKQEYVSARYRLYRATHEDDPAFIMRDVLMLDCGEGQELGHYTEDLRSAFRSSYAIFDKIGLFLNDYLNLGIEARKVNFRRIWYEKPNRDDSEIRSDLQERHNLPLRGLYYLSKDLFDKRFKDVAEPHASQLARLRQQVEHRFLSFLYYGEEESTETHQLISTDDFRDSALHLLKMAREALIYVSLAMHVEEYSRKESQGNDDGKIVPPLISQRNDVFDGIKHGTSPFVLKYRKQMVRARPGMMPVRV